jgi:hypothetical protein
MTEELPVEDPDEEHCVWCSGEVKRVGIGRRRKYCSHACRQAAFERRRIERAVAKALDAKEAPQPSGELPSG